MTARSLTTSVGAGGGNLPDDVFTVQMLLNHVDPGSGGPNIPLVVDGLCGPKTITAINSFQSRQFGFYDGLVEPAKRTYTTLLGFFRAPEGFPDERVAGPGAYRAHRLVYRDVRLQGSRPAGDTVIEVDADTPLQWFLDTAVDTAVQNPGPVRMKIMAHGGPARVLFCREDLLMTTLSRLTPLRSLLAGIDLFSCSIAFIAPGSGDGNLFCSSMAQLLDTYVRASTAPQVYTLGSAGSGLDFGRWEGTVLTYGPRGDVVHAQNSPRF